MLTSSDEQGSPACAQAWSCKALLRRVAQAHARRGVPEALPYDDAGKRHDVKDGGAHPGISVGAGGAVRRAPRPVAAGSRWSSA